MVLHEAVAEVVDAVEVDGSEVPVGLGHHIGRRRLDVADIRQNAGYRCQALILLLVDAGGIRDKRQQM
jgi:hypothetical protein